MIQRYSEISDGKRYHAINRDPQGEWCKWEDVEHVVKAQEELAAKANECISRAESYRNLVANRLLEMGRDCPMDASFNSMVDNLIEEARESAKKPRENITDRLSKSSDFLLQSNCPIAAALCQEAADEIENLRQRFAESEQAYNRLLEDTGGMRGRN